MDNHIVDFMRLDTSLERFIEEYVDTFIKWEIIQFFYDHANKSFKVEELVTTLNRPLKSLKRELKELNDRGLLHENKKGKNITYLLDILSNDALKKQVEQFIAFCQGREGRLRIIYKVLKDGRVINN